MTIGDFPACQKRLMRNICENATAQVFDRRRQS